LFGKGTRVLVAPEWPPQLINERRTITPWALCWKDWMFLGSISIATGSSWYAPHRLGSGRATFSLTHAVTAPLVQQLLSHTINRKLLNDKYVHTFIMSLFGVHFLQHMSIFRCVHFHP
jgi:hypothetical protein